MDTKSQRIRVAWILVFAVPLIVVATVVGPNQVRPTTPPKEILLHSAADASRTKGSGKTISVPKVKSDGSYASDVVAISSAPSTSDEHPPEAELVASLLPIKDLSVFSVAQQKVAREWNERTRKDLVRLLDLLSRSSELSMTDAIAEYYEIKKEMSEGDTKCRESLSTALSRDEFCDASGPAWQFLTRVQARLYANHGEYVNAAYAQSAAGDREGAVFYCRKAGFGGRSSLAVMTIEWLAYDLFAHPDGERVSEELDGFGR